MIESGGASGESIEKGYIEPLFKEDGHQGRARIDSLGKLRAIVEQPDQHDAVRARLGHRPAGQEARPDREGRLGGRQSRRRCFRGEERVRLRLSVLLDHLAWRKGAKEPKNFAEFFDTQGLPWQAHPCPTSRTIACRSACQAVGVPDRQAVPLDVDLAFKKLNEIKKDVAVWRWKAGPSRRSS